MPTASGAHILLDDDEFMIDRSVDDHYVKRWYDVDDEEDPRITGDPGKVKRNPESLFWTYTDWAGGEGVRAYDTNQYDTYDVATEVNPRLRGQLTGRPMRGRVELDGADVRDRPAMAIGQQAAWVGGGYDLFYMTNDPSSWTAKATSGTPASDKVGLRSLSTSYRITAMVGDNDYVYYAGWHSGSSGSRVLLRAVRSDSALADTVEAQATGVAPYAGLAIMNGKLYAWTGRKLFEMDIDSSLITTSTSGGVTTASDTKRKVLDTRVDPSSTNVFSASWWADCVATENSVICWYSNDGVSEVYEFKKSPRPIWRPPYGFTIKGSCYSNGIMYFSGHWGGDENDGSNAAGYGVLYALPLDTYNPIPLKKIRQNQNSNLQMQEMHASYGYQIITVAQRTGRIFVYDAETDGLSMLDDLGGTNLDSLTFTDNDNRIAGSVTFGKFRLFSVYRPGAGSAGAENYQLVYYKDDEPDQREDDLNATDYTTLTALFQSPRWDFNYPLDKKTLVGFHLTFKPLVANQFIDVSYDHDDDGSVSPTSTTGWTSLTQITSATAGANVGRVFIPVSTTSSQVKFHNLKFRVALTSGPTGTVVSPILYAVSAEAKLVRKRKEWQLALRVKDEPSRNASPINRRNRGWRLRDWLEQTIENGNVVTLRDGYRYKDQALYGTHYSSHNVIIKEATDIIEKAGEGTMLVLLRDIDNQDDA